MHDVVNKRRVYSKKRVFQLLKEVAAHGSYMRLLMREGINPVHYTSPTIYYDADQIDELIKAIKA